MYNDKNELKNEVQSFKHLIYLKRVGKHYDQLLIKYLITSEEKKHFTAKELGNILGKYDLNFRPYPNIPILDDFPKSLESSYIRQFVNDSYKILQRQF